MVLKSITRDYACVWRVFQVFVLQSVPPSFLIGTECTWAGHEVILQLWSWIATVLDSQSLTWMLSSVSMTSIPKLQTQMRYITIPFSTKQNRMMTIQNLGGDRFDIMDSKPSIHSGTYQNSCQDYSAQNSFRCVFENDTRSPCRSHVYAGRSHLIKLEGSGLESQVLILPHACERSWF